MTATLAPVHVPSDVSRSAHENVRMPMGGPTADRRAAAYLAKPNVSDSFHPAGATVLSLINDWPPNVPFEAPGFMVRQQFEFLSLKSAPASLWRRLTQFTVTLRG